MQPSEFWRLPVADWWAELDWHIVESRRLEERLGEAKGGKKSNIGLGHFTEAEWADARRRFKENKGKT